MQEPPEHFHETVRQRFAEVAVTPDREKKFPVGPESAKSLGYDPDEIDELPSSVTASFCGVGNPLGLGELRAGESVLDLGSGTGLDSILAARQVGPGGRVIGVDMTPEMITKSRDNVQAVGLDNVEFRQGTLEALPVADADVDVIVTNGVFNLCPEKPVVLSEAFRVLRPGGSLRMADILLHEDVTPEEVATRGEWSD